MIIRYWVNIVFLVVCAYGACEVIAGVTFTPEHWQYYFYLSAPWALLFGSAKAWHRSFIWRRMLAERQTSSTLSRGEHRPSNSRQRSSILEHASFALLILAFVAILEQLEVANTKWWIGSLLGACFMLRLVIGKVN
jgi:hypothetical protein